MIQGAQYEIFRNGTLIKKGFVFGQTRFKYVPPNNDAANYTIRWSFPGASGAQPAFLGSMTFSALVLKR